MKKSRIARRIAAVESPGVRSLPLVELLVETKAELFELMVRSGLRVLDAMRSEVVLGGRKVAVHRPRVRGDGRACAATGGRFRCRRSRGWRIRTR